MDEFDILKELEKLDDDLEPGFLRELRFEAPEELHSRIMNSIRQEVKPRSRFNYKKYTAFAAAAALIVCVYIGGGKSLLFESNPTVIKNPASEIQKQKVIVNHEDKVVPENGSPKVDSSKSGTVKVKDNNKIAVAVIPSKTEVKKPNTENTKPVNENKSQKVIEKNNIEIPGTSKVDPKQNLQIPATNNEISEPTVIVTKKGTKQIDEPLTNSETTDTDNTGDTNDQTNLAITPPEDIKEPSNIPVADNTKPNDLSASLIENTNTSAPGIDIINFPTGQKVANISLDSFVNYEINLNMSQISIIQFIKEKGTKISEVVYKLSKTDYNMLNKILEENGVSKTEVNIVNGEFVIIKMIMY